MPLASATTKTFRELVTFYKAKPVAFPQLRQVSVAQWALESGWGTSDLARKHLNFGGAKWRNYMRPYSSPVSYAAHDGTTLYCKFPTLEMWIDGYWARFDLEPAYKGWRAHTATPERFMNFIGPIWLGMSASANSAYVRKVFVIDQQIADVFDGDTDAPAIDKSTDPAPWDRLLTRDDT